MSGFSAEWLALREPADAAARSSSLASFATTGIKTAMRGLDLGGGTGANVRYLSSRLRSPQHWTIVDNDASLLARAPAYAETHRADLNTLVDDETLFHGCTLVTASALLDLVSEAWLAKLVLRCRDAAAAVLFALSYDGRIVCSPEEPEDDDVRQLVNAHQKTDKGFGPALGPDAAARAIGLLSEAGYTTRQEPTDWKLTADMQMLQRELVTGWAGAASEMAPERSEIVKDWHSRRMAHIDAGRSRIVVGHIDVAGIVNR